MGATRRRVTLSTLASIGWLAAPALLRRARADTPIVLKLHHGFSAVSAVHDKFLLPWARKVEADSGGRLRIDLYPSMQLGGAPARLYDQVRDGVVDLGWVEPSLTPGRFPRTETFELAFVPSRRALVSSKALQDFAGLYLKDEFGDVRALAFSCGDRGVLHAGQAIRTIEDIKGMKLQPPTRLAAEAIKVLGGQPVAMPLAQVPMALSEHVIEAALDPWHVVPTLRLNDWLKVHTEFSEASLASKTYVLVMNKAAYDRMPREAKAAFDANAGQQAAGMAGAMWDLQAAAVSDSVAQRGDLIATLLPEAVAHWRKAVEPVHAAWLKEMREHKIDGAKLLASARNLVAKYALEPEPTPPEPRPVEPKPAGSQPADAGPSQPAAQSAPAQSTPAQPATAPAKPVAPASVQPASTSAKPAQPVPAPAPAPAATQQAPQAPAPTAAPVNGAAATVQGSAPHPVPPSPPLPALPQPPAPSAPAVTSGMPSAPPVAPPAPAAAPAAPAAPPTAPLTPNPPVAKPPAIKPPEIPL